MSIFSAPVLTRSEMDAVAARIAAVEKTTTGELRVSIHRSRSFKERNLSVYDLAVKNFHDLGMQHTKEKTGVLIYLLLSDRKFQIIGDEGINKKVSKEFWDVIALKVAEYFREKKFLEGLTHAIDEVGKVLQKDFPMKAGDTNELSNEVIIS